MLRCKRLFFTNAIIARCVKIEERSAGKVVVLSVKYKVRNFAEFLFFREAELFVVCASFFMSLHLVPSAFCFR